jgi:branched-chain amino acid transport system ATP-binding protein
MTPLLSISGLVAGYGTATVLHGIDVTVAPGELVAIVGGNGAGKSTLLRTISGLVRARDGTILFEGRPIENMRPEHVAALGIAHVPEGRHIFPDQTTADNLLLGAYRRCTAGDRRAALRDVEMFFERFPALANRRRSLAGMLSGGEQQMLAIARALIGRPKLVMLDEPSHGLAPIIVDAVLNLLSEERDRGTTILLIEQLAQVALSIADRGYVLTRGRVTLTGPAEELLSAQSVEDAYLGGAARVDA